MYAIVGIVCLVGWFWLVPLITSGEMRGIGRACGWYWRQGRWTLLTAPLFVYLVFGIVVELYKWVGLSLFLSIASRDLLGETVGFVTLLVVIMVLLLSPALWYSLLKNTPEALGPLKAYQALSGRESLRDQRDYVEAQISLATKGARWRRALGWLAVFVGFQVGTYGLNRGALALGTWMVDRKHALSVRGDWLLVEPPLKKTSPANIAVDVEAPPQRWTVERAFESLDACQRVLVENRDKPPTNSDLMYFPVQQRPSLTAASLAASHKARCVSRSSAGAPSP
jgi:hypothetical protein